MPNELKAASPTPTAQFPAANCQYFLLALHQIVQVTVDQHFHRPFIRPRFPSQRTQRIFESDKSELLHSQTVLPFGNPKTQSPRTFCKRCHTWFSRVLGRLYFWKCSKPNDFSRRLSMSGSAIPKRLLFKRFRLQWKRRDSGTVTGLPLFAETVSSSSPMSSDKEVGWSFYFLCLSLSLCNKLNRQECQCCDNGHVVTGSLSPSLSLHFQLTLCLSV